MNACELFPSCLVYDDDPFSHFGPCLVYNNLLPNKDFQNAMGCFALTKRMVATVMGLERTSATVSTNVVAQCKKALELCRHGFFSDVEIKILEASLGGVAEPRTEVKSAALMLDINTVIKFMRDGDGDVTLEDKKIIIQQIIYLMNSDDYQYQIHDPNFADIARYILANRHSNGLSGFNSFDGSKLLETYLENVVLPAIDAAADAAHDDDADSNSDDDGSVVDSTSEDEEENMGNDNVDSKGSNTSLKRNLNLNKVHNLRRKKKIVLSFPGPDSTADFTANSQPPDSPMTIMNSRFSNRSPLNMTLGGSSTLRRRNHRRTQYTNKHKRASSKTTNRTTIKRRKSYRKYKHTVKRRKSRRHHQ
jgi:hypothetical protein